MKTKTFILILGLFCGWISAQSPQSISQKSQMQKHALVAILPTLSREISGGDLAFFTEAMHLYLADQDVYQIISESELQNYYKKLGYLKPPACRSDYCFRTQSQLLGSDLLISNWLTQRGDSLYVDVEIWNQREKLAPKIQFSRSLFYQDRQELLILAQDIAAEIGGMNKGNAQTQKVKYTDASVWEWSGLLAIGATAATTLAYVAFDRGRNLEASNLDSGSYISSRNTLSGMRGFFATPTPSARAASMGQAGLAGSNDVWSVWRNPAGSVVLNQKEWALSRETHSEIDRIAVAFAGPFGKAFSYAHGAYIEGDSLATESRFTTSLATDLGLWSQYLMGLKVGVASSLYLLRVGQGCDGMDCSYGDGVGYGLDVGLQWKLSDEVGLGVVAKDVINNISYQNRLTGLKYKQGLPSEMWFGSELKERHWNAVAQADYRLSIYEDQPDRLHLGAEVPFWDIFFLRGGWQKSLNVPQTDIWSTGCGLKTIMGRSTFKLNLYWTWADLAYLDSQKGLDLSVGF